MPLDMFDEFDITPAVERIKKIPFGGYTGNKKKIIKDIWYILDAEGVEFESVFDAFSGSAVFSLFMKEIGKRVISNDFLTSSYLNALALVENPGYVLNYDEMLFVMNNVPDFDVTTGFVYRNYKDVRFTEKECIDLDRFRANLSLLDNSYKSSVGFMNTRTTVVKTPFGMIDRGVDMFKHRIKQMEKYGKGSENHDRRIGLYFDEDMNLDFRQWFAKYNQRFSTAIFQHEEERIMMGKAFLLRNMENNILSNCFIGGRYNQGQVIAKLDHRLQHEKHKGVTDIDFVQTLIADYTKYGRYDWLVSSEGKQPCLALNCDIIELLENTDFITDMVYLDPPYGGASSDYAYLYQFLEEFVYGEKLENLEHIQKYGKRFSNAKTYEENFTRLLSLLDRFPIWVISYNDSSWQSKDYIVKILKQFRQNVRVFNIDNYVYNYRDDKTNKAGTEYVFVVTK